MKFFVLLYINSPVFEKQIKAAKNKWFHFPIYAHTCICMCVCVCPSILAGTSQLIEILRGRSVSVALMFKMKVPVYKKMCSTSSPTWLF